MSSSQKQYALYPSLVDKVVVISGGATGIGGSMSEAFALQGSRVIILDIQDEPAEQLIHRLAAMGARNPPEFHHCDMTDISGAVRPTATRILDKYSRVDGVINNAAHDKRMNTLDISPDDWDQGLNVNVRHHFFLTQALMPGLVAAAAAGGGGASIPSSSVINLGSIAWAIPTPGLVPYNSSKSAVVGLTRTLAHEFGPRGVRVNSIMPGAIATERQKRDIITPEYEAEVLGRQALKRLLQPDDVARLALWLVADDSSGVTNQSIVVDGGWI
jgi:D-xylose 1-dehydrogenase